MIPWATIEPGLCVLVEDLIGLKCEHDDGKRSFANSVTGCAATYLIFGVLPIGLQDERRFAPAAEAPSWGEDPWGGLEEQLLESVAGVRELTWRVKVEANSATAGDAANQYIEALRDALAFTSTHKALALLGLSYIRTEGYVYQPTTTDDRRRPYALVDIRLGTVGIATDTRNPYNTIETVSFSRGNG